MFVCVSVGVSVGVLDIRREREGVLDIRALWMRH